MLGAAATAADADEVADDPVVGTINMLIEEGITRGCGRRSTQRVHARSVLGWGECDGQVDGGQNEKAKRCEPTRPCNRLVMSGI